MAELVPWSEEYSVQVPELDAQHKCLATYINRLHAAMAQGKGRDVIGGILDEMIRYTDTHFAREEALMAQHGYPDLENHRRVHATLRQQILEFQRRHVAGTLAMTGEVLEFLRKGWLVGHICSVDKRYAPFLCPAMQAAGARPTGA